MRKINQENTLAEQIYNFIFKMKIPIGILHS